LASRDHDLDEYGLPLAWRLEEGVDSALIEDTEEHWAVFEDWCRRRGYSAFPASPATVLAFLDDQSRRANLREVWTAIDLRHEAYYWNSNANPALVLEASGVVVGEDGAVIIPPGVREHFR
jgi:hypothetical protein